MTDPLFQSYRTYVYRIRKFLFLGGVLPSSAISPVVAYSWMFAIASSCFGASCAALNFWWHNLSDLSKLTRGMSLGCSLIATALKVTCFMVNRKNLLELEETLEELFNEELSSGPKRKSVVLSLLHTFDKLAYSYSFSVFGTLSMYLFPPLVSIILQHVHHVEPKKYILPFPALYPWHIEGGSISYQIHYVYEAFTTWFLYFTNSGVDSLFGFYIFHIASVMKTMTYRLENPEPNESRILLLRTCVKKHLKLIRCRDIVQQVYGPIVLWLVLTNAIVMCAVIFYAFQNTEFSFGKAALFVFYMFLKLLQTFMYAWYGGIVTTESENFAQGLYFSDWLGKSNRELKTEMIITMLQKPLTVTASSFFVVSVNMFPKIVNTTVSYFFLLKTLDEGE